MRDQDPQALNLDVYESKQGWWNPEHGDLELPADWEFLPSGDTFVTRRVKAAGVYWNAWRPRGKNRPYRRKLGLVAPTTAISQARAEAERTAQRRAQQRVVNTRHRDKVEDAYRVQFAAAVFAWLDFAPEHVGLAEADRERRGGPGSGRRRWQGRSHEVVGARGTSGARRAGDDPSRLHRLRRSSRRA